LNFLLVAGFDSPRHVGAFWMIELLFRRLFCCPAWQQLLFFKVDESIVMGGLSRQQWLVSAFIFKD
jgi:hypothetical protein